MNTSDSSHNQSAQELTLSTKSLSGPSAPRMKRKHRGGNRQGLRNFARWKKNLLLNWLKEHREEPYPSEAEKEELAKTCQLSVIQICNWFTNARKR